MSDSLLDLISPENSQSGRMYGLVMAIVTNNQDPEKMGRVKVKFPWLSDDNESWWARIATPHGRTEPGHLFFA